MCVHGFVFLGVCCLFQICILAMRVSGAELALVIFTGMRLMLDAYLGGLSLKNLTVEEYGVRTDIAVNCWCVLIFVWLSS